MRKNYRVTIENGEQNDSFTLLGKSKKAVQELCSICHIGTGWNVTKVELAMKSKKKKSRPKQLSLF